jgi:hypothetical protein
MAYPNVRIQAQANLRICHYSSELLATAISDYEMRGFHAGDYKHFCVTADKTLCGLVDVSRRF